MYFPNNITSIYVSGKIIIIRENKDLRYSACFVLCSIPMDYLLKRNGFSSVPESVSIVPSPNGHISSNVTISNQLPVLNSESGTGTFEVVRGWVPESWVSVLEDLCMW